MGNSNFISLPQLITKNYKTMKEIKTERKKCFITKRILEFSNHQFAVCSDIKTRMVWVIFDNKEPLSDFKKVK